LAEEKLSCPSGKFLFSFDRINKIYGMVYFLFHFPDESEISNLPVADKVIIAMLPEL